MSVKLKPLSDQVVVITGASSGIGLATARRAAKAGAAVVLNARNDEALRTLCDEIVAEGGRAHAVAGDVGDPEDVATLARAAVARFGRVDTWINDAGVGLYGDLEDTSPADHERLFRTNYFGVVNGSLEAVKLFKAQRDGGAIINVGSVLCDMSLPQMGAYAASKHAVKGFTDALRMELRREKAPVSVSLIKPTSVSSPFADHARNYMEGAARMPSPVYAPEVVADAILHAAQHPVREMTVGAGGGGMAVAGATAPGLAAWFARFTPSASGRSGAKPAEDSLHHAGHDGHAHAATGRGRQFSVYATVQKHPGLALGLGALAVAGAAAYLGRGAVARGTRPLVARAVGPMVVRAAMRRPGKALGYAARHPRQAARLAQALS